jgi:hypothetical protein
MHFEAYVATIDHEARGQQLQSGNTSTAVSGAQMGGAASPTIGDAPTRNPLPDKLAAVRAETKRTSAPSGLQVLCYPRFVVHPD